ncbi:MAG: hypothetical protein IT462_17315 [Planctomycetes bacterium]|nr:hypothetical protein [Planctomycetota bacterium]
MKPIKLCLIAAAIAALAFCTLRPADAEGAAPPKAPKAPKEAPKPTEPAPTAADAELERARETVAKLPPREYAIYYLLLRLIRPRFGAEPTAVAVGSLRSMEEPVGGPLNNVEMLRLWAVLESGADVRRELDAELRRLVDTPLPPGEPSLARCGIEVLTIRAALRTGTRMRLGLEDRLKLLLEIADKASRVTTEGSGYNTPTCLQTQWFANHLWRALIARSAVDLKLAEKSKLWDRDLDLLCNACAPKTGFTGSRDQPHDDSNDLHSNLFAWSALALAASAPEKVLTKAVVGEAARCMKNGPDVLARLGKDYPGEAFSLGHLSLSALLATQLAPGKVEAAKWREGLYTEAKGMLTAPETASSQALALDLGLHDIRPGMLSSELVQAAEQSLMLIGLCGGMWTAEKGPLVGKSVSEVGLVLYAMSLIEQAERPQPIDPGTSEEDLNTAIIAAIDKGCRYLLSIQAADGSFPGEGHTGSQALCILTLLHGGYARTCPQIARAMAYVTGKDFAVSSLSYECGIILMMFQKFYEAEQIKAGVFEPKTLKGYSLARQAVWNSIPAAHRTVIQQLVVHLNSTRHKLSGWGYSAAETHEGWRDNSCSQYAMLGYRAASFLGAAVEDNIFVAETNRLLNDFITLKGGSKQPRAVRGLDTTGGKNDRTTAGESEAAMISPGGWGYQLPTRIDPTPAMTAAGVSSLMICLDEMRMRTGIDEHFEKRIREAIEGGLAGIGTLSFHQGAAGTEKMLTAGGWGMYTPYSIERGCVIAGVRLLCGDIDWYRIIARTLVGSQETDGKWRGLLDTCWAILCLRKASMPVVTEPRPPVVTPDPMPPVTTPDPKPPVTTPDPKPPEPKKPVITEGPSKPAESKPAEKETPK